MRKRVYLTLKALYHGDIVSVYTCKLDGMSARVRNEISKLRKDYAVEIVTEGNFVGRNAAYFLDRADENIKRVKQLLERYEKKENQTIYA